MIHSLTQALHVLSKDVTTLLTPESILVVSHRSQVSHRSVRNPKDARDRGVPF